MASRAVLERARRALSDGIAGVAQELLGCAQTLRGSLGQGAPRRILLRGGGAAIRNY